MSPARDLQLLEFDVVLEDIDRDNHNLVGVEPTARVAGCEATHSHDKRPQMASPWPVKEGRNNRDTGDSEL